MKSISGLVKLFISLIITVSLALFVAAILLQDKVALIILGSLNKNISTGLDVGSVKLSFLRKFPNASIEFRNIIVQSSRDFNRDQFTSISTDTLLQAESVFMEFRITDIIKGNYIVETISASQGKINFFTDTAGHVNYDIKIKSNGKSKDDITIDLRRINLSDFKTAYYNLATRMELKGLIRSGKLKSRISGNVIDFTAGADLLIDHFKLYNTTINEPVAAALDLTLHSSDEGIRFGKSTLAIEDFNFALEGLVSAGLIDLNISGNNIALVKIRNYLPEKYLSRVSEYDPSGKLQISCKIKGLFERTRNPHVEIKYSLGDARITYKRSGVAVEDISFNGFYSNGRNNRPETSSVSIEKLKFRLGGSDYECNISITDFTHPVTAITLEGKIFPADIKDFFNLKDISTATGNADVKMSLSTNFWPVDSITLNDIISLKPVGVFEFNSFSFGWQSNRLLVSNVNGILKMSDAVKAEALQLEYKKQKIKITGEFINLPEWLTGRPVELTAKGNVSFDRFIPETYFAQPVQGKESSRVNSGIEFPSDLKIDMTFRIDSLDYKTFSSDNITGTLNYKPGMLTFTSLNMHSHDGIVMGNGFIMQNSNKSLISKGSFTFNDIDINKTFRTFKNFGQDFIKAENLSGNLSGSVSVLLPMDADFTPRTKSLSAEGTYILNDGALIDFEPVKQLSSFIELAELENIHFQKIENDFFIRNSVLFIPQMDVKSSAADLSVNGQHSFGNKYEYHVKMLLSQLLSRKRKKNKNTASEFGVVQDDGLGRTSILLKIEDKGAGLKVGYDLKAAGVGIKNNFKSERQTLKTIFKEEYGWYKEDPPAKQVPAEKKSRFTISWEETDSIATKDSESGKAETNKGLFRKK